MPLDNLTMQNNFTIQSTQLQKQSPLVTHTLRHSNNAVILLFPVLLYDFKQYQAQFYVVKLLRWLYSVRTLW
jgi:hypothetical protein